MSTIASLVISLRAETAEYNKKLEKSKKQTNRWANDIRSTVKFGAGAFAVLAATAGTALAVLTKQSLASVDALGKTADQLGTTTEAVAGLRLAAELGGESAASLDRGLKKMQRSIGEAALGTGQAKVAFKEMGIELDNFKRLRPEEQFAQISDKLNAVEDASKRAALAGYIFGRSGQDLLNTMQNGSKGLEQIRKEAEALGLAVSRVDAAKVEAANDAVTRATKVSEGLGNAIAVKIAPYITEIANSFYQSAVASGGFKKAVDSAFKGVIKATGFVLDSLNGVKVVFSGIKAAALSAAAFIADGFLQIPETIAKAVNAVTGVISSLVSGLVDTISGLVAIMNELGVIADDTTKQFINMAEAGKLAFSDAITVNSESVIDAANSIKDSAKNANEEFQKVLNTPPPSVGFYQWAEDVQVKAQETAEAVTKSFNNEGSGSVVSEQIEKDFQSVQQFLKTREQLEVDSYNRRREMVNTYFDSQDVPDQERRNQILQQLKLKHENTLTELEKQAAEQRKRIAEQEKQRRLNAFSTMFGNLASLQQSNSKKMFEIGKKAAIAQTIINTYSSATKAYDAMASIPYIGPALGAAAAAAAIIAGLQNVRAIKAQSFGGGGGGSAAVPSAPSASGGGAPSAPTPTPANTELSDDGSAPRTAIYVENLNGNDSRRMLDEMRDIVNNEDYQFISPDSRNGQDLAAAAGG